MDWLQFIRQFFDYDRWANRQWLSNLGGFKNMDRAFKVMAHILESQWVWLERCGVERGAAHRDMPLEELFALATATWIELLETSPPDEMITYKNFQGQEYTQQLAEIALHVINHGTYHRGQLRGLAAADGFESFPDTDYILYLRETGK